MFVLELSLSLHFLVHTDNKDLYQNINWREMKFISAAILGSSISTKENFFPDFSDS